MTTRHTPGPWTAFEDRIVNANMVRVLSLPTDRVSPRMSEEAVANARLIAAAPELLEALRALTEKVRAACEIDGLVDASLNAEVEYDRALAVIAKAEGR